jgi:hypothetical protein
VDLFFAGTLTLKHRRKNMIDTKLYPLGQGLDSIVNVKRDNCIVKGEYRTRGTEIETKTIMDVGLDIKKSSQSLGFSFDLGLKELGIGFGITHEQSSERSVLNISLYRYSKVLTGIRRYTKARMDETIKQKNMELHQFINRYGDSYINHVKEGGVAFIEYKFFCKSIEEREQLKAKLNADIVIKGIPIGADLNGQIENISKEMNVNCSAFFKCIGIDNKNLPEMKDFNEKLQFVENGFQKMDMDSPQVMEYEAVGYEYLEGFDENVWKDKSGANAWSIIKANRETSKKIFNDFIKVKQLSDQIDWIKMVYDRYGAKEHAQKDTKLIEAKKTVNEDINLLNQAVSKYKATPAASIAKIKFSSLNYGNPFLAYEYIEGPQWGGDGGSEFNSLPALMNIEYKLPRISYIQMRSGDYVSSLMTSISVKEDMYNISSTEEKRLTSTEIIEQQRERGFFDYAKFMVPGFGIAHEIFEQSTGGNLERIEKPVNFFFKFGGNSANQLSRELQIKEGESITNISGAFGSMVDRLRFSTKYDSVEAGGQGGSYFEYKAEPEDCLIAFRGKAGAELDRLQPIYLRFNNAKWQRVD